MPCLPYMQLSACLNTFMRVDCNTKKRHSNYWDGVFVLVAKLIQRQISFHDLQMMFNRQRLQHTHPREVVLLRQRY